jgi:hypothetical protein
MKIASDAEAAMRWSQQPRLKLELALQLMVAKEPSVRLEALLGELEELKKKVESAGSLSSGATNTRPAGPTPPSSAPLRREAPEPGVGGNLIPLRDKSPAPLRGTVKATPPTLRADQFVPPPDPGLLATFLSRPDAGTPSFPAPPFGRTMQASQATQVPNEVPNALDAFDERPAVAPQPVTLGAAEWSRNWPKIVDEVRKEKIAIGHLLAETSFHAASGNSISIACPDDFHADLLKRNRLYISALAERIYGARVQFDSILAAAPSSPSAAAGDGRSAGDDPARDRSAAGGPKDALNNSPLVEALVREFGAEEIG